jgi:hypothetical protein
MSPRVARAAMFLAAIGTGAALAPNANASLVVTVSIDGNQVAQFSGTNGAGQFFHSLSQGSTTFSDITVLAASNATGTTDLGTLAQASISVSNSTGSGTLKVDVTESTPFISPGAAGEILGMQSIVSRSDGGSTALTFQSFVTTTGSTPGTYTWGLQKFDAARGADAGPNSVSTAFARGATYMLHNVLTLQAGSRAANVSGTTFVTPEPTTLAALISGLPVLAIGARRWLSGRRNRNRA